MAFKFSKSLHEHPFLRLAHLSQSIQRVRLCVAHPHQFIIPHSVDLAKSQEDASEFVKLLVVDLMGKGGWIMIRVTGEWNTQSVQAFHSSEFL